MGSAFSFTSFCRVKHPLYFINNQFLLNLPFTMNKMFELTVLITEYLWPRCAIKSCLGSTQLIFGITVCIAQVSLGVSRDLFQK